MKQPLVSIITPVYNSEKYIAETMESVLSQTYQNWEHLLVDDCSTDNSWLIIQSYAEKDKRIKPFRLQKNCGSGVARNLAIKEAKGKYIAFLDSDDLWVPEKLEKHINFMFEGNIPFSHTSYGFIEEDGTIIPRIYKVRNKPVDFKYLLRKTDISCLTAVYDQELIGKYFMPELKRKQDYVLWLSILKDGIESVPYPEVLAYYRQRKNSTTSNKTKLIFEHFKLLHNHIKLNFFSSCWYTAFWGLNGIKKYYL